MRTQADPSPTGSDAAPATRSTDGLAALAGAVSAAVALGVGELVSGFSDTHQSLVVSVGNQVIEVSPEPVTRFGIDTFGTGDKPALVVGIVVLCLAIGAVVGRAAQHRRALIPVVFGAFGFAGMVAGITDPLADGAVAVVASLIGAGIGAITLTLLLLLLEGRVAVRPSERPVAPTATGGPATEHPTDPHTDRRAFFGWTGGLAAFAVLSAAGGRRLRGESVAETARAEVVLREPRRSELSASGADLDGEAEGLSSFITPNEDFYRIDTAIIVPQVDPANWSLTITGMVDTPVTIGYDELLDLATVETTITMACVSNPVGGDLIGNAVWQGVALGDLLDRAGVQDSADQIVGRSVDDFTVGFPTEVAFDGRPALVAVGMNGEPVPIEHGFPARLVVSGLYGYVSATKWLSEIELTTWDGFDSYWVPRGWSKSGPVKTQSRIDVPRDGASVAAGDRRIAGVAWAPHRGIDEVEVQVDDGPWTKASLGDPLAGDTWRQWVVEWDAQPGRHTIRVRATDSDGETQTSTRTPVDPDGATGWHSITVGVDD